MKTALVVAAVFLCSTSLIAQQPTHPSRSEPIRAEAARPSDTSLLLEENANLKSDLAQLRSMLNVLASQQSGTDSRSFAALQTNRQMWQVIIARLAELTQRLDALEQRQRSAENQPRDLPH